LEGEAVNTLQNTQATAYSAASYADVAMQEARRAMLETTSVRKTVKDALAAHLQASTSLSGQQVTKLAQDTSAEFQAAVGEQRRLEKCLHDQQAETERLRQELHHVHAAQSANVQAWQQNQAAEQATTTGKIEDLKTSLQRQKVYEDQRSRELQEELGHMRQQQAQGTQLMTARTEDQIAALRTQLETLRQNLEQEREQREKVHKELAEYKAYWEEPLYENEGTLMDDVPNVPGLSSAVSNPVPEFPASAANAPADFQFHHTSFGQSTAIQNPLPTSGYMGEYSAVGPSLPVHPVQSPVNPSLQR
jgi:hypothetical protein